MKLIQQSSFNECGVCVANMLVNYYQKRTIAKSEILQQVHLSTQGISILELEEVCEKYGIILESYDCQWEEIWQNSSNGPVILLLSRFNAFHFILVLKEKREWVVYDPIGKTYPLDISHPLSDWSQIAIFTSCPKQKIKPFSLQNPLVTYLTNSWSWLFWECSFFVVIVWCELSILNL